METPTTSTRIFAAAIGAFTSIVAAGVSVVAYVVFVGKEPLLASLPAVTVIGGVGYGIAALFGIVGGTLVLIAEQYRPATQLMLAAIFAALAGVRWGDWASGGSPHISKFFAEVVAACSWVLITTVAVLARQAIRR
jgi:hypothetical protein